MTFAGIDSEPKFALGRASRRSVPGTVESSAHSAERGTRKQYRDISEDISRQRVIPSLHIHCTIDCCEHQSTSRVSGERFLGIERLGRSHPRTDRIPGIDFQTLLHSRLLPLRSGRYLPNHCVFFFNIRRTIMPILPFYYMERIDIFFFFLELR
jgi:hypothetical protein